MTRHHLVSPAQLSAVRDLELFARTTVEGLRQGLHRSPFHGYSAEFSQYRHYRPGDDLKYVDWKLFGRTDRFFTRQFRETTNLSALFVVDASRSMDYPAAPATKFHTARAAAAALAALVIDQGDTAGLLAHDGTLRYVAPRSGRHHLHLLLGAFARLAPSGTTPVGELVERASGLLRRKGLLVVLTDGYEEGELVDALTRASRAGHDVILAHVLADAERHLPAQGAAEFVDLESGGRVQVDAGTAARAYREAVAAFEARVRAAAAAERIDYLPLAAEAPIEPALRRFLLGRRRGQ